MRQWPPIDSRQYITAVELHSTLDCPPDFELPPPLATFDAGIFLPHDDPDWFGRSSYPPRIVLLKDNALHLISHPAARQPPTQWELDQISAVESGHLLLKGWLRFSGPGFDSTIRYNTRGFPPVYASCATSAQNCSKPVARAHGLRRRQPPSISNSPTP